MGTLIGIGNTIYQGGGIGTSATPSAPLPVLLIAVTQTSIALTFNKAVSGTEEDGFTFSGTTSVTVASATGLPSNTITFNINETLYNDSNVLLSYSSVTGDIIGVSGSIDLATFSNSVVTVSGLPAPSTSDLLETTTGIALVETTTGTTLTES